MVFINIYHCVSHMRTLQRLLNKLEGKLLSIERNTMEGYYELRVGLPKTWVYKSTSLIDIETIVENDDGVLLLISPLSDDVQIDDLIDFVNIIVETNEKIAKKEDEFNKKMEEAKKVLESQVSDFYDELEELKQESFKTILEEEEKEEYKTKPKATRKRKTSTTKKEESKSDDKELDNELLDKLS